MSARLLAAGLLGASLFTIALDTRAYCRARTCDPDKQECEEDEENCIATGAELFWASECVTFAIQKDGSRTQGISADAVEAITTNVFRRWLQSDCDGAAPSLRIGSAGRAVCTISEYNERGRNANVVMFRDEAWPYPGAADAYGFTRVRFDTSTGEIFDADIEINSYEYEITVEADDSGVGLESILTHEVGHFLGLGHAAPMDFGSTMRAGWDGEGTDLRNLSRDDQDGMCAAYPPDRTPTSKSCDPRHGFASECGVLLPEMSEAACSVGVRRSETTWLALFVGLVGALGARRRMTRRR